MSKPFVTPCRLESRNTALTGAALTLAHSGVYLSVWTLELPAWLAALLLLPFVVSLWWEVRRQRQGFVLFCNPAGQWSIRAGPRNADVTISPATVCSRAGLFLVFRRDGRRFHDSRFLPAWSLDAEDYRRVRQRIRLTGKAAVADSGAESNGTTWSGKL